MEDLPTFVGGGVPYEYMGAPSVGLHNSYPDQDGNILFFVVDDGVYDNQARSIGYLKSGNNQPKRGFNQMLVLPMGNSCSKYAILYPGSADYQGDWERYTTDGRMRLYLTIYDTEAENYYGEGTGSLLWENGNAGYRSLIDISERDGSDFSINPTGTDLYDYSIYINGIDTMASQANYRKQIKIASTSLIDNCFYYVFVSDGKYLIRYKLDKDGLHWDNYKFYMGVSGANTANRAEMEMILLANGNYRIAVPVMDATGGSSHPSVAIKIYDLDSNFEVLTEQTIDLKASSLTYAYPKGLEFDKTGRYLYFTHEPNTGLPNYLDVWDVQTQDYALGFNVPAGFTPFKDSYIERYDDKLFVVSTEKIGELSNISNPAVIAFNNAVENIDIGYGNNLRTNDPDIFGKILHYRTIMPSQIDDADYFDFEDRSCECCEKYAFAGETKEIFYEATNSELWSYGVNNNPWNAEVGDIIYIRDYLQINPGTSITIDGLVFKFAPDARVIVKRGTGSAPAARLHLKNKAIFTADFRKTG